MSYTQAGLAVGVVVFIGEIFGTGVLTIFCGIPADTFGLDKVMLVPGIAVLLAIVFGLGRKETAYRVLEKKGVTAPVSKSAVT